MGGRRVIHAGGIRGGTAIRDAQTVRAAGGAAHDDSRPEDARRRGLVPFDLHAGRIPGRRGQAAAPRHASGADDGVVRTELAGPASSGTPKKPQAS